MTDSHKKAVIKKMAKIGYSTNEIKRELNKIQGINEPIRIKTKEPKETDDGHKAD